MTHARRHGRGLGSIMLAAWVVACLAPALMAAGRDPVPTTPPPPPPTPSPAPEPTPEPAPQPDPEPDPEPESSPLPSLDELLDLPTSRVDVDGAGESPIDEAARELERRLAGEAISDRFEQAADFMARSAERLSGRDVGLTTQRLQQDALDRLDWLIENAERQQQQQSQGQGQPQDGDPQQQPAQPQGAAAQQEAAQGSGDQETQPPSRQDGALNPLRAAAEAAWGALPERVRESLVQGSGDEFSATYRAMTERYYRRLAEEGGP